ncbi:MAG: tRNA (adenosine(37)-N6)-threonylcarbamoyltransferase complex transferase subunit TsaD [Planctomycetota bacterium]|nr:tRNA (adenosine(37)-N6)-threonylcarbamoyltransferase complex transferase subunit TsaD [Planctomycetota bacterium]MDA1215155.1 tRNA (adenosine(37)-N6)-threonylcarbamoyltransferase complex transferase subunit TsaD [Planctomycetota bacterium]
MTAFQPLLLAIESSCDETAAAVIARDLSVLSNVVASQAGLHERYGGVVPEVASRAHLQRMLPVIDDALNAAGVTLQDLTAIAVATEPGLVGSLLVGLTAAKTLALTLDIPLVPVNHIEAHLFACRMIAGRDIYPAIGFVVSGGHTNLYRCRSETEVELIGSTIDDAAGEAFDKVAAMLGLDYPGGPSLEKAALNGDPRAVLFPRAFLRDDRLDFSFSGLKTAVRYAIHGQPNAKTAPPPVTPQRIADLSASVQQAIVDILVAKCRQALKQSGLRQLCIGGGVAANTLFRSQLELMASEMHAEVIVPPMSYCTDNAAMGAIAWKLLDAGRVGNWETDVVPGLVRKR